METGWTGLGRRSGAAAAGMVMDRLVGEPAAGHHPVVWFGRAMRSVERAAYQDRRSRGVVHALAGCGLGAAAGSLAGGVLGTWASVAGRELHRAAGAVADALSVGDLGTARVLLPSLVGRDPTGLDSGEIARAAVESVAENTVDALVAPVWWAVVGGGLGVGIYRAANTLDAMVGHRTARHSRYGWASARIDDLAGWVPARLTAVLVASAVPSRAAEVAWSVRHQAPAHPSPNAGVAEAAFAAALGLGLGGVNRYGDRSETRPTLGRGRRPESSDIAAAITLSRRVGDLLLGVLVSTTLASTALASTALASTALVEGLTRVRSSSGSNR
ncbi:MAG: cobalamin biosynthesis protein [Acidimicrobiales bacterium]